MDRLDEFAIFVRIVEESSLVRAASRLRRSAPAVTRALASLEARLGVRLIDRTTRRLAPTEAGRALYDKARIVLGDYEAATARRARSAGARPVARCRARPVRPPPRRAHRDRLPRCSCRCRRSNCCSTTAMSISSTRRSTSPCASDRWPTSGLTARSVGEVRRLWVASPGYLKRRGMPATPADLVGHEAVLGAFRTAPSWDFARSRRGARADCRPAEVGRHRDAASGRARGPRHRPSSCRIRSPTISRPVGWCACCAPTSSRRSRYIC